MNRDGRDSKVVSQPHRIGPYPTVPKRIGCIAGAAEQELVLDAGEKIGLLQDVVLDATFQASEGAVLYAVAVNEAAPYDRFLTIRLSVRERTRRRKMAGPSWA